MTTEKDIVLRHPKAPAALLDVIRDVQSRFGQVSDEAVGRIAAHLKLSEAEVRGAVTFYHFFSLAPRGASTVYLNDSITSRMAGRTAVARAFEQEAGCRFGEVSADGTVGLFPTSCIGMNDQEPSAIVDGVVFTALTPDKARAIVRGLRAGTPARDQVASFGDGANQSDLVRAMVVNNIRRRGPVLFGAHEPGAGLRKAVSMTPDKVIDEIKRASLLGRGGAGFPTGLKWEFCRREAADRRFVVCNADEGEPGTFKDRVILTELPALLFEGMAVAGYAIGAKTGVLYLRSEYAYLRAHLESVLAGMRRQGLLGKKAAGAAGFDFDIVVKSGAGAYICGEESALLESAEGKRGEPRDRPPFPVQTGYLDQPTTVNNVETLATAARIMAEGAAWFKAMGTAQSAGTKLLSVSGDCSRPGVYEVEYGLPVADLLEMAGGAGAKAVQVGGPSGTCVAPAGFGRKIDFSDLATGGSVIVFGPEPRHLRGRLEFHGVLRRRVLRLVRPLPGRERPAQEEVREGRPGPRHRERSARPRGLGPARQEHEPVRARTDLPQSHPDDPEELPRALCGQDPDRRGVRPRIQPGGGHPGRLRGGPPRAGVQGVPR